MFPVIKSVSQVLEKYLEENISDKKNIFEFKNLMARFNISIISSVAFGIDNDCINEPEHIFLRMGTQIFSPSLGNAIRGIFALLLPSQFHNVGLKTVDREVEDFLYDIVKETVEYREKNDYSRDDLMQLLIQLKNQGYVSNDKNDDVAKEKDFAFEEEIRKKLTMNELTANSLVFFTSGKIT